MGRHREHCSSKLSHYTIEMNQYSLCLHQIAYCSCKMRPMCKHEGACPRFTSRHVNTPPNEKCNTYIVNNRAFHAAVFLDVCLTGIVVNVTRTIKTVNILMN